MGRFLSVLLCSVMLAAPSMAAAAETPADRQRKLIDELLTVIRADQLWPQMFDAMLKGSMDPQELARVHTLLTNSVDGTALLRDAYTKVYFKYYTEDDVRELIAFYKTPLGQKMLTVMPNLTADVMSELRQALAPKLLAIFTEISAERQRRFKTVRDLRAIGTALEAWALSEGSGYPEPSDMATLAVKLRPVASDLPVNDAWDHPYAYAVSADRKHYRVVCAGSDGIFEHDSLTATSDVPSTPRYSDDLTHDIIYADGRFVQFPQSWR